MTVAHAAVGLYGLMASFDSVPALMDAAKRSHAEGYRHMDGYTPFPVHGLDEALGFKPTSLPYVVLAGGILGCIGGYSLCYYASVIDYPLNIGGRPFHSWPAFIPVTFECTILAAALSAVLGMLAMNGLPEPYHPVFNVPGFALASKDRFFLAIEATDPKFDRAATRKFLESLGAKEVSEIAP